MSSATGLAFWKATTDEAGVVPLIVDEDLPLPADHSEFARLYGKRDSSSLPLMNTAVVVQASQQQLAGQAAHRRSPTGEATQPGSPHKLPDRGALFAGTIPLSPPPHAVPPPTQLHMLAPSSPVASTCKPEPSAPAPLGPNASLTASQRGELELAKARAERAAAGRGRGAASRSTASPPPMATRQSSRQAAQAARFSHYEQDDDSDDDSDVELAKLSPEEQERLLSARLANGSNDKDARRLKRLLRNRVSAQQARERKKQYVTSLEETIREHKAHIDILEKRLRDIESQNEALRNIVRSIRPMGNSANNHNSSNGTSQSSQQQQQDGTAANRPPTAAAAAAALAARRSAHAAALASAQHQAGGAAPAGIAAPAAAPGGAAVVPSAVVRRGAPAAAQPGDAADADATVAATDMATDFAEGGPEGSSDDMQIAGVVPSVLDDDL